MEEDILKNQIPTGEEAPTAANPEAEADVSPPEQIAVSQPVDDQPGAPLPISQSPAPKRNLFVIMAGLFLVMSAVLAYLLIAPNSPLNIKKQAEVSPMPTPMAVPTTTPTSTLDEISSRVDDETIQKELDQSVVDVSEEEFNQIGQDLDQL